MKSAFDTASSTVPTKLKRARLRARRHGQFATAGQATLMASRSFCSAPGPGSVAIDVEPAGKAAGGPAGTDHAGADNGDGLDFGHVRRARFRQAENVARLIRACDLGAQRLDDLTAFLGQCAVGRIDALSR